MTSRNHSPAPSSRLRHVVAWTLGVGLALLTASRHLWSAWYRVSGEADT